MGAKQAAVGNRRVWAASDRADEVIQGFGAGKFGACLLFDLFLVPLPVGRAKIGLAGLVDAVMILRFRTDLQVVPNRHQELPPDWTGVQHADVGYLETRGAFDVRGSEFAARFGITQQRNIFCTHVWIDSGEIQGVSATSRGRYGNPRFLALRYHCSLAIQRSTCASKIGNGSVPSPITTSWNFG
jgi:hypothetical protein